MAHAQKSVRTTLMAATWSVTIALLSGVVWSQEPEADGNQTAPVLSAGVTNASLNNQTLIEQTEWAQKLLDRVKQLEQKAVEAERRAESAEQAHREEVQKLMGRINELEGKLGRLNSGRSNDGLAATTSAGPTIRELEQKIQVLERNDELATEEVEARAKQMPRLTVGPGGFALSSADTNFVLKVRGLLQTDWRTFFNDSPYSEGNDGFLLRRARPIFEGTVFRDFDFQLTADFAGTAATLVDAWVNYRYRPELQLRIGKMKGPVGLENLQSDTMGSFNERSMASDLVPVRNIGLQLGGDIAGGTLSYAAGIFNGGGDGRNPANSDYSDNKEFAGRVFLRPFQRSSLDGLHGLGLGVSGSYADINYNANALPGTTGGTLPGYVTSGLQQFFAYNPATGTVLADGTHWRLSPQGYYYFGPFGLLGEYVISDQGVYNTVTLGQAKLHHTAWQASAQWVLTGEPASFTGLVPKHPFDPGNGSWGAWQFVARVSQLRIDEDTFPVFSNPATSASEAFSWAAGLNWWLNRNIRVLTSFSYTTFDGGGTVNPAVPGSLVPPATVTHQDERAFLTRVQLAF